MLVAGQCNELFFLQIEPLFEQDLLPLLAVGAMQDGQGAILVNAGIPLLWLAISIWMLRSYEKIAGYLLQKIPQKFWPK